MLMTGYARSGDGMHIASAGEDLLKIAGALNVPIARLEELNPGIGRLDALDAGQIVNTPSSHAHRGSIVAVSNRTASPGLVIVDVCSGEVQPVEQGGCAWSSVPAVSPSGDFVAYQGVDGRVRVVATEGGRPLAMGSVPSGYVCPVWSASGRLLAWDTDGVTEVMSVTGEQVARFEGAGPTWLGHGDALLTIRGREVVMCDPTGSSCEVLEAWLKPGDQVWAVHGAAQGSMYASVASVNGQLVLAVHDWFTGESATAPVGADLWPWSVKWSPDCTMIAAESGLRTASGDQTAITFFEVDRNGPGIRPIDEVNLVSDPRYAGLSWNSTSNAVAVAARAGGVGAYAVHVLEPLGAVHRLTGRGDHVLPDWGRSR